MSAATFEAVRLRGNRYAVKPAGTCGTCGWIDGRPWTVVYVTAKNDADAVIRGWRHVFSKGGER